MAKHKPVALLKDTFQVLGEKEVFLPSLFITLLRTPKLSPFYAKFQVPLNINKLDLKDYLFNLYGIQAQHIRSHIKQSPVVQGNPRDPKQAPRRWFRPQSKKYMTVQMDRPFVWPAPPEDYTPWDRDIFESANETQKKFQKQNMPGADQRLPDDAKKLHEHADRLLSGKEQWRPGARDVRMFSRTLVAQRGKGKGVASLEEVRPR